MAPLSLLVGSGWRPGGGWGGRGRGDRPWGGGDWGVDGEHVGEVSAGNKSGINQPAMRRCMGGS